VLQPALPDTTAERVRGTLWVGLSLAGMVVGLTLLFLGMRAVMEVGGACADGGPYVSAQPCPDGAPLAIFGGVLGGLACTGVYAVQCWRRAVPSLIGFAWPALFLSLGWNFLEFGLDPPGESGLAWGWLICAALFALMGGVPLFGVIGPTISAFRGRPTPPATVAQRVMRAAPLTAARKDAAAGLISTLSAAAQARATSDDLVTKLERLASLHERGALTDSEYEAAKRRLLDRSP